MTVPAEDLYPGSSTYPYTPEIESLYPSPTTLPGSGLYPGGVFVPPDPEPEEEEIIRAFHERIILSPYEDHRNGERWEFHLLHLDESPAGMLDGVSDGDFKYSIFDTIRSGGTINYDGPSLDWTQYKIQPWYVLSDSSGIKWPMGVFLPEAPSSDYSMTGVGGQIELYDKLLELDQDGPYSLFSVPKTIPVTEAISQLLTELGKTKFVIQHSDKKLSNDKSWLPNTSWLKIINELLDAINYFSLEVDGYGFYRVEPYVGPNDRSKIWTFRDDERSITVPEFTMDDDFFSAPNRFVLVSRTDGESDALVAVAENNDPASRLSYAHRKRWITRTEEGVEAADQATLDAMVLRRLQESSDIARNIEMKAASIPLSLNSVVEFEMLSAGVTSRMCTVQKFSYSTNLGAPMNITLRELS